jgi:hypothetical protein
MALKRKGMGEGHLFVEYLRGEGAIEKNKFAKRNGERGRRRGRIE